MTRIWFKAKRYGWGWYPHTWQGWLVLVGYILILIWNANRLSGLHISDTAFLSKFIPQTIILTLILISISAVKGEPPRWRWGK